MWDMALTAVAGFVAGMVINMIVPVGVRNAVVFPTPANADSVVYQDPAGVCHSPHVEEAECVPGARPIPVQA
jgi:hypothetical protein